LIPMGSAKTTYKSKLFVIGVIQIDDFDHEIRGFAIYANNDGEVLLLKSINIKYGGVTPIQVSGILPFFFHHIKYNPA
ncbi:MAG: hypothetical protein JW840_06200, partial [Candidatus Thermoplasmatota archaeon]|nr:hypothetical protein [Candidatus Thermoplasmatota archaeon]